MKKCKCGFKFASSGRFGNCQSFITKDGKNGIVCPGCGQCYVDGKEFEMPIELTPIEKEYSEVILLIKKQKKGSNIDKIILDFLKKQIKEIKAGKRNDLDIGDIFPIAVADTEGYRISDEIQDLIFELGDYKIVVGELGIRNIKDAERVVNEIILKRKSIIIKGGKIKDVFLRKTHTGLYSS